MVSGLWGRRAALEDSGLDRVQDVVFQGGDADLDGLVQREAHDDVLGAVPEVLVAYVKLRFAPADQRQLVLPVATTIFAGHMW